MGIRSRHMRHKNYSRQLNRAPRLNAFLAEQAARLSSTLSLAFTYVDAPDPDALNTGGSSHGFSEGDGPIRFSSSGTLPAPLRAGVDYFVRDVIDSNDFRPSPERDHVDGSVEVPTDNGTGTHTVEFGADEAAIFAHLRKKHVTAAAIAAASDVDSI